jgi:glycosyltransferase involved in cell wall biosynthesis
MKRVFHGPINVAGAAELIARAQRAIGYEALSVCFDSGNFAGQVDKVIRNNLAGRLSLLTQAKNFEIFQFYFGTTLLGGIGLSDVRLLKNRGKQVYFYFCGCDIRDSKRTIEQQQFSACSECWPQKCHPKRDELELISAEADGVFVSTPDLLEFVPNSILLPQPIDLSIIRRFSEFQKTEGLRAKRIRIVHAPSDRKIKGTRHLLDSVEDLQRRGLPVELDLVEGRSYSAALEAYAIADIAVDQLLIGSYGQFSVEAMALGKPVVCYLREDLRGHYPADLPIVSANPTNLTEVLEKLISEPETWRVLGHAGERYVDKNHDPQLIGSIAANYYKS